MSRRLQHVPFLTSGSWLCPAGVTRIWLYGYGGGGGGAGGAGGHSGVTASSAAGGGAGGGAVPEWIPVDVVPGTTYTITIGAAGSGGAAGPPGTPGFAGGEGGDTIFTDGAGLTITFKGAHGGIRGQYDAIPPGGGSVRADALDGLGADNYIDGLQSNTDDGFYSVQAGFGGWGAAVGASTAWPGMRSYQQKGTHDGTTGTRSSAGAAAADSGAYKGGGGGGGGGNSGGGVGGNGGNGGAANNGGNGTNGTNGNAAGPTGTSANTGAGGGGGGGAGSASGIGGTGGSGAAGGSGKLVVSFLA